MLPVVLRRIPIERVEDTRVVIRVVPVQARNRMAIADLRQDDDRRRKLGDGVTGKRPLRGLADQLDQDQTDDEAGGRSDDLLDRIDPDRNFAAGLEKRRQRLERALAVGVCLGPRD